MKILLLTHKADIDGITPVILTKIVFKNFDYVLLEAYESNEFIKKAYYEGLFDKYDKIYITDLGINKDVCEIINDDFNLKSKLLIFDHHDSCLFVNDYSFGTVINEDENNNLQCGTSLYYKYLLENYNCSELNKKSISDFVELVRQYDTWEWFNKYKNNDAKKLTDLFIIYGIDYFIEYFYNYVLNNREFKISETDEYLLKVEQEKVNRYIEQKEKQIIETNLLDYNVGMVFAENYRSELGNTLARKYESKYDFIVIIDVSRSISYRGIKNIDLSEVAHVFGGKGSFHTSGSKLPNDIKEEIVRRIFNDKVQIKENNKKISFDVKSYIKRING